MTFLLSHPVLCQSVMQCFVRVSCSASSALHEALCERVTKHCVRKHFSAFYPIDVSVDAPSYFVVVAEVVQWTVNHQPHGDRGVSFLVGRLKVVILPQGETVASVEVYSSLCHFRFRTLHFQYDRLGQGFA